MLRAAVFQNLSEQKPCQRSPLEIDFLSKTEALTWIMCFRLAVISTYLFLQLVHLFTLEV